MVVTSLLEHCPPPTPMLTNVYGTIMKVLKKIRAQITLRKILHVTDSQNMSINANIAKVQAKDVFFLILRILNLWLDFYKLICKILVLWGYSPLFYSRKSNCKSNEQISRSSSIKQVVWRWLQWLKKSVCWVCIIPHQEQSRDIIPHSQFCYLPYWFAVQHNCDLHSYLTKSHLDKHAGLPTSVNAIDPISGSEIIFHCYHQ